MYNICKFNNKKKEDNDKFIQSPLNYTGGKYKILDQLISMFPKDINVFYDVFCGGANVGANMNVNKIICIDKNERLISLIQYLQREDYYHLIKHLEELINYFSLSNTNENGYEYYDCNSSDGLSKYNKDKFLKLRKEYNDSKGYRDDLFLLLIIYGFNNQIRFNNKGEYNLPVGKRDLNASLRKKLRLFMDKLHVKDITFHCQNFRNIDIESIVNENAFLYLDPPYWLGTASYNENGGWTMDDEKDLLDFLKKCDEKNIRFALSNMIEHKGKINEQLIDWCLSNEFNINYIHRSYNNSSYHLKDKSLVTKEVLITNY